MPIYEYECEGCHKVHEVMQKFSDAPLAACPDCGKSVHKIMSRTSFALKGTGWYSTDYKKSAVPPSLSTAPGSGSEAKPTSTAGEGAKTASAGPGSSGSDSSKTASPAATPASAPASSAALAGNTNKAG